MILKHRDFLILSAKNGIEEETSFNIKKGVKEVKYPLNLAFIKVKKISNPANTTIITFSYKTSKYLFHFYI